MDSGRIDSKKNKSIRNYLQKHFSNNNIEDKYDFTRGSQIYKINTENGILLAVFSEEFINDNDVETILIKLDHWKFIEQLVKSYSALLLVTTSGLMLEPLTD